VTKRPVSPPDTIEIIAFFREYFQPPNKMPNMGKTIKRHLWLIRSCGTVMRRVWCKVHLGIDKETLILANALLRDGRSWTAARTEKAI